MTGIVAILCINLIFAYGIFVTAAAGQLNLGGAGFQAIGAYARAWLSSVAGLPAGSTIPAADADFRARRIPHLIPGAADARRLHGPRDLRFRARSWPASCCARRPSAGRSGMVVPDHVGVSVLVASAVADDACWFST